MARPGIIAGHCRAGGYYVPARSTCCNSYVVYKHPDVKGFIRYHGYEPVPEQELRCYRCNKLLRKPLEMSDE
jgi:hypothetical protein